MSTSRWFSSLLRGNPELYRQIHDWNFFPHRWALPGWLHTVPGVSPSFCQALEQTPRSRERLGRHVREALGLTETFWDFEPKVRRLALLPATSLAKLAAFAGATYHWSALSRAVSRSAQQAVIARIGADAHAYALRRGRPLLSVAGVTPPSDDRTVDAAQIPATGWWLLESCLATEPAPLLPRARLKFPHDLPPTQTAPASGAWALLQPLISETLPPADRPCFV
jgi:hypothetical protein